MIITLLVLATIIFLLARVIGNPVDVMLSAEATPAERELAIHKLGLDRPLYVQYAEFMRGLLRGDVGESLRFNQPVVEMFFARFPNTLRLAIFAFTIAIVFGFALGWRRQYIEAPSLISLPERYL
jgi:peptide/nickel transport system permease protein